MTDGIVDKTKDKIKELEESLNKLKNPVAGLSGALGKLVEVAEFIGSTVAPFSQVQKSAAELATAVGLSSKSIMRTAMDTIAQNRKMQLSMSYNISNKEILDLQKTMMLSLGRNVAIDQVGTVQKNANGDVVNPNFDSELENLIAASKVFGNERLADIISGFDKLGISMKSAAKATGKLYQEAGEYGISLQKYTENFTSNLEMAQMYNFRNGVDGLKEMARKATEIRQNMRQIASFADKVGSVTGAVETAANLQVLGGSFAALSNPLAMLNESLTDMNGLQNRFNSMTAGAARYNSVTHEIEMDPVTRQIMKRAAESMGVDPANLIDQAYAQARREEIDRQIKANGIGGFSNEVLKLLPNVGEFDKETGAAGATIEGKFYDLAKIGNSPELQQKLIEETRSESDDIKVIAKSVMTIQDLISGQKYQAENEAARNNIMPGSVNNLTSYEIASKLITEKFNPSVYEAAGRIDLLSNSFKSLLDIFAGDVTTGTTIAADAILHPGAQGAGGTVEQVLRGWLGDSDLSKSFSSFMGNIAEGISNFLGNVNEYTVEQANFNLLPGRNNTSLVGQNGSETPVAEAPKNSIASSNQGQGGYSNGFMVVMPSAANTPVLFMVNPQSVPHEEVSPANTHAQNTQQTQTGAAQGQDFNYTLNLTGNLTMDINGDNGKIGTVDLKEMLEKNHFELELSKAILETITRMNRAGMIQNP